MHAQQPHLYFGAGDLLGHAGVGTDPLTTPLGETTHFTEDMTPGQHDYIHQSYGVPYARTGAPLKPPVYSPCLMVSQHVTSIRHYTT